MTDDCEFLRDLPLDSARYSFEPSTRDEFAADYGTPAGAERAPDAVVWPSSTADVVAVVEAANERGVPITPYAAGSGTQRNAVPVEGGVTLAMSGWTTFARSVRTICRSTSNRA